MSGLWLQLTGFRELNIGNNSTAPQTAASKMNVKLNQHLSKQFEQKLNIITFMKEGFIAGQSSQTASVLARCTE